MAGRPGLRPLTPCPGCGGDSFVVDVRKMSIGPRRRYECHSCQERFTTYEVGHHDLENMKRQYQLTNRPVWAKALDGISSWRRFGALTWPSTIGKLSAAATERIAINPIETAIGKGVSDTPYISIGKGLIGSVKCTFSTNFASAVAEMTKGERVTIRGIVDGQNIMRQIELNECRPSAATTDP